MPFVPRGSRLFASVVAASAVAGAATFGVPAVAGAQTDDDRPPAECGPGRHGPGRGAPGLEAAAGALNLSVDELRERLREGDGQTLAEVAQQQNVDVQTVIDAMVADATQHIDEKVQQGDLTQEEADERKAELPERITRLVNEGPRRPHDGPPPEGGPRGEGEGAPPERSE